MNWETRWRYKHMELCKFDDYEVVSTLDYWLENFLYYISKCPNCSTHQKEQWE
jgi:aryl carrier-like protein